MGEVYLAMDMRLDRQVAIKALPAHLAADADRLARFQREAKVVASLSHPGIGAIYGVEEAGGHQYLILEFVAGETLAERLVGGPIPMDEALGIARQIAEALEAAHEKSVVHRDLKPANVMITADGTAKVLDFGLARTADGPPSSQHVMRTADSPTVTTAQAANSPQHSPTVPGVIMGTAGYMSPEQARGKPVDKRSDIFSFGCLLYEMLSGSGPFPGETVTDSLGAILHREPEWGRLPATTPPRVRELLASCMVKDRRNRLHDIGDARIELERAIAGKEWTGSAAVGVATAKRSRLPVIGLVAAVAAVACGVGWVTGMSSVSTLTAAAPQAFHVSTLLPSKPEFGWLEGLAPDGRYLVYVGTPQLAPESTKATGILMIRRLDRDETLEVGGTEGARAAAISPDGKWLAFVAARDRSGTRLDLKRVGLQDGRPTGKPEMVCELPQGGAEPKICWASARELVFSPFWDPTVYAVAATGGEPRVVLRDDLPKGIESWAEFRPLEAGKSVLGTRWSFVGQKVKMSTEVIDLASGKRTVLLPDAGMARYIMDGGLGYLIAARGSLDSVIATRFDLAAMKTVGDPVTIWSNSPLRNFDVSNSGTLVIDARSTDVSDRQLAWLDEKGEAQSIPGMVREYANIAVSPDGGRVAARLETPDAADLETELWVQDIGRRTSIRIPLKGALLQAIWSRDGERLVYGLAADGEFGIWERRSDGSGEAVRIYKSPDTRTLVVPTAFSPDGKTIAIVVVDLSKDNADVFVLQQDETTKAWAAKPYLQTPASEELAAFSPDGKWALLSSAQSGRAELYLQRFSGDGEADGRSGRVQVSGGGVSRQPVWWGKDGSEIRYVDLDNQMMSVQVKTEPTLSVGEPKVQFSVKNIKWVAMGFAADGRQMAIMQGEAERTTRKIDVVVNFLSEMREKMRTVK
jgi:hypothetical protein